MPRITLTPEEAEAMLPEGDDIHVFCSPAVNVLVGADWGRSEVLEFFKKNKSELAGPMATGMDHGIVGLDKNGWWFFATKKAQ